MDLGVGWVYGILRHTGTHPDLRAPLPRGDLMH